MAIRIGNDQANDLRTPIGNISDDFVWGSGGNDVIYTYGGDDEAHGGPGNDSIFGGDGDDWLYGFASATLLFKLYTNLTLAHDDVVDEHLVDGQVPDWDGDDFIAGGSGNDHVWGGAGNDTLYGSAAAKQSGSGQDWLDGGYGHDLLFGGDGNDSLSGGFNPSSTVPDIDVAEYQGSASDYTVKFDGKFRIKDNRTTSNNDGYDSLSNIELLKFADKTQLLFSKWGENKSAGTSGGVVTWNVVNTSGIDISSFGSGVTVSQAFSVADQSNLETLIKQAFNLWATSADIKFVQVASGQPADMNFFVSGTMNNSTLGIGAFPEYANASVDNLTTYGAVTMSDRSGDVVFNQAIFTDPTKAFLTAVHEIGHAIGLMHVPNFDDYGNTIYSIMNDNYESFIYTGLQPTDVAYVQALYGAPTTNMNDGFVSKGYLSGATVFADANGNGVKDADEAFASTDEVGHFQFQGGSGQLIAVGGIDIGTKLPFQGKLIAPAGSSVITPLTTLISLLNEQDPAVANQIVKSALGINVDGDLRNIDPIEQSIHGQNVFIHASAKLYNAVIIIASTISGATGSELSSTTTAVFEAITSQIVSLGLQEVLDFSNLSTSKAVIDAAFQKISYASPAGVADSIATVVSNLSNALDSISSETEVGFLSHLTAIERLAHGEISGELISSAGNPAKIIALRDSFTGSNLALAIQNEAGQIGDVDGPNVQNVPIAVADSANAVSGTPLVIAGATLLANDTDADGNTLSITGVSGASHGSVSYDAATKLVTFTPDTSYTGPASFTYAISDGQGGTAQASVAITVAAPANQAPVSLADSYSTNEDTVLTVPVATGVLANDTDANGDPLTAALVAGPKHGTLSLNANGSFAYTPDANYSGGDGFTYKASDGSVDGATTTVSLMVNAVNDVPLAVADSGAGFATTKGKAFTTASVLANDFDPDQGDSFTLKSFEASKLHGTLKSNGDGTFVYTPDASFVGTDSFTYTIADKAGLTSTTQVDLTVSNTAPPSLSGGIIFGDQDLTPNAVAKVSDNGQGLNDKLQSGYASGAAYTDHQQFHGGDGSDTFILRAKDFGGATAYGGISKYLTDFQGAGGYSATNNDFLALNGFGSGSTLTYVSSRAPASGGPDSLDVYKIHSASTGQDYEILIHSLNGKHLAASDFAFYS